MSAVALSPVRLFRDDADRAQVSVFQRPWLRVPTAVLLTLFLATSQLAILPAALEASRSTDVAQPDPFSIAHLVSWLEEHGDRLVAASAPTTPVGPEGALSQSDLDAALASAIADWEAADPSVDLTGVTASVADLPDLALGTASGSTITIDVDAAGHGWDVTFPEDPADAHMDLATALRHELGHVLGVEHETTGLMAPTLAPGETATLPAPESTETTPDPTTELTSETTELTSESSTDLTSEETTELTSEETTEPVVASSETVEPVTDAWVVEGDTATYTATSPLDHTLVLDADGVYLTAADGTSAIVTTEVTAVVVLGSSGDDHVTVASVAPAGVAVTVDLGAGHDTFTGPSTDQVWTVDGSGAGVVAGVAFAGAEDLVGGADNEDEFVLAPTGTVAGVIDGGPGGYDSITVVPGDFSVVSYTVTGPDSGTIERDGDLVTYRGMEPITHGGTAGTATCTTSSCPDGSVSGATVTLTGTSGAETITLEDNGNTTDGLLYVRFSSGEDHLVDLSGVDTLEVNGGDGADSVVIAGYDDALPGLTLALAGDGGSDTLTIPDLAGTWKVTGIGSGSWEGEGASALKFTFATIESLVGATSAAETYDFQDGAGLQGSITDGTGQLTVRVAEFGEVTGDFAFGQQAYSGQTTDAAAVSANAITVGGSSGSVFFGVRNSIQDLGVTGTATSFGLAILTEGAEAWQAWTGTFESAALQGMDELGLDAESFSIAVNTASASRPAIDFGTTNLVVTPVTITLAVEGIAVSANGARASLADFVWIEGTLTFERGDDRTAEIGTDGLDTTTETSLTTAVGTVAAQQATDGVAEPDRVAFDDVTGILSNVPVGTLSVGLVGAELFVGRNPAGFALFDEASPDDYEGLGANGIVALGLDLGFGMMLVRPEELDALLPELKGLKGQVGTIQLIGLLEQLGLVLLNARVSWNSEGEVDGQTGSRAWARWAASFPGTSGLPVVVPGSTTGVTIDMDDPLLALSADDALLSLAGFVTVQGGFSYEKGATASLDVVKTGTTNGTDGTDAAVELATTLIGVDGASVFAGLPGDFTATNAGFTCTDVETTTAVGICASGIELGLVLASPTDTDSVLPDFLALQGSAGAVTFVGLPPEIELELRTITFGVNRGGAILDGPGGTAMTGSNAYVDWTSATGGAFPVPTGSTTSTSIDLDEAVVGVAAERAVLDLAGFVSVAGSFAIEQGGTETVELGVDGLDTTQEASLETAVDGSGSDPDPSLNYDAGVLSGVELETTLIGIGGAAVFAGYSPDGGFDPDDTDGYLCTDLTDAYGFCATGIEVGLVLAALLDPDQVPGWTLPRFMAMEVDVAAVDLLGLPTSIFDLDFVNLSFSLNQSGALAETTTIAGSRAWVRWGASFPDTNGDTTPPPAGLPVPTGSGDQYIAMDDPILALSAETVLLTVGDFLAIRGSFAFEKGAEHTVVVETSGLGTTEESAFYAAVDGVAGLGRTGGTVSGIEVTTTLIGIGGAAVFAGYYPSGFDVATAFTCAGLTDAYGICADGIEVGIVLAALTDPDQIPGYRLPGFTGARIDVASVDLLGIPTDVFDIDFTDIAFTLNTSGAISTTLATISGSSAWIDWTASFPDPDGDGGIPAGLPIATGSGTQYISMIDPIIGVTAERIALRIGSFVSVAGSFAFFKGGLIDLAIDTPALDATQQSALQGTITDSSVDGDSIIVNDVATQTLGVGSADVYVGYADGGFGADGTPIGGFYGLTTTGIDLAMIWATIATARYTGTYRLPSFFGLTGDIAGLTFAGIPADILSFDVTNATVAYNSAGEILGFTDLPPPTAHVDWSESTDSAGTPDGVTIPTGSSSSLVIDHEDAIVGLSAETVVLTIGSFIHVSGSFAFEQGGNETLDVRVLGLSSGELTGLEAAVGGPADKVSGTIAGGDVTINDVLVTTTLLGIGDATVFAGYNPGGFASGTPIDCTDAALQADGFGFCLDNVELGLVIADAVAGQTGAYTLPQFLAVRANLPSFDIATNLVGLGALLEGFQLYFEGLQVVVNQGGDLGSTVAGTAFVDWAGSWSDKPGDGLLVPTGTSDVLIDFDSPIIGVSADVVVLSIAEFVHISGSFAFTTGGLVTADVDVTPTGVGTATRLNSVVFQTTTFGISNAALFVGYNPNAGGSGVSFDIGPDKVFTSADLTDDATGILLSGLDFGMVFASATPGTTGGWNLPTFSAIRAKNGTFELVNLLPDAINVQLEGLGVIYTSSGSATGPGTPGTATIDWSSVTGGGYDIPTGTTTAPIRVDVRGAVIGVEATLIVISISEFVHVSGGFSLIKGQVLELDIETNDPVSFATSTIPISATDPGDTAGLPVRRTADGKMLWNVDVETMELGIIDASIFVGYANLGGGSVIDITAGDDAYDDVLDETDVPDAFGLLISDVDLGMVLGTIKPGQLPATLGQLPRFTTVVATAEQVQLMGLEDILTLEANGIRVEVNLAGRWQTATGTSAAITPAVDWESSFTADGGYDVSTGEGNPPIRIALDGYLIGGGAELVVISILDFVHLRGSFYFESGVTETVPLSSTIDLSIFEGAIPAGLSDVAGLTAKELRFFNIGVADAYAFVGLDGPHWYTEDPADATSDIRFECDPDAAGPCVPATDCPTDSDITDGIARDVDDTKCQPIMNEDPLGLGVSDLDFAMAIGTPTLSVDPTRYLTIRASVEFAGLVGFDQYGLTGRVEDVAFELNIATPTLSGFPILPVIDWAQYAVDNGCDADDVAAQEAISATCDPFGVKTGQRDSADADGDGDTEELLTEDFFYEGLFVRAAVGLVDLDLFGVIAVRGSLAFNLGPTETVTLADVGATVVPNVLTMTLGGANLFAFIGVNGPHWQEFDGEIVYRRDTDGDGVGDGAFCSGPAAFPDCELADVDGDVIYRLDTDADGDGDGAYCDPDLDGATCVIDRDTDAIGLALTDLDFGLFVGASLDPTNPAVFFAADISIDSLGLVGIPGLTADAILAVALNLGFTLGGAGASFAAINFKDSFSFDEPAGEDFDDDGVTGETGVEGYLLDTGDAADPMHIAFDSTFVEVQLAGSIEIRAGPDPIVRIDGIFYLGIDLDAGAEEFRLLALGEMTIGPDIGSADPLLSIGAIGVLILNGDGIAGDFTVNLQLGGPIASILEVAVYARVIFNTAGQDMAIELPDELYDYLTNLGAAAVSGVANPGPLASDLIDRLEDCDPSDGLPDEPRCYVIEGSAPNLVAGVGPDVGTIAWLLGDGPKSGATFGADVPYLVAVIDGSITVLGFASASVFGAIRIDATEFELIAEFEFQLGSNPAVSILVGASAIAEISSAGFYLNANVVIQANLLSVFDLDVSGSLTIDTRGPTTFFQLSLNGSVSVLRVLTLSGSVTIVVGGPLGVNAWYFGASLSASFGPLGLSATGFVASWGSFKFEMSGYVDLTFAGTGIRGTLTAHASYCLRDGLTNKTCLDDINAAGGDVNNLDPAVLEAIQTMQTTSGPLNDGGRSFLATLGGSVAVKFLGITLASVSVDLEVYGYLGGTVKVRATFRAKVLFATVSKTVTIATFTLPAQLINGTPPPPLLGEMDGTTLRLNVGSRANLRNVSPDEIHEEYVITRLGDRHYRVTAFGWTEDFTNVDHIEGYFGGGDDELIIYDDVTATVYADMGDDDDRVHATGSGVATLYGGNGNDVLIGGSAADYLDGGAGDDFLDGGGAADTMIGGANDDTFFGYGDELAGESLSPGSGYDRIEIIGRDTGEVILLSNTGTALHLTYDGGAPVVLTGMEELLLRVRGGDAVTIAGAVDAYGLSALTIGFSPDTDQILATQEDVDADPTDSIDTVGQVLVAEVDSSDTVTIRLLDTTDNVTITGSQSAAPPTFAQGEGISAMIAEDGDPVPTTTVQWAGHIDFVLSNTELGATSHDYLILETLGGADDVAIRSIETDTVVRTGNGNDEVFIGSGASCASGSCTSGTGTVDGINAPLSVDGGGGNDVLDINDASDTSGDTLLLTGTVVGDGIGLHEDLPYSGFETLDIRLGSGNDQVRVQSTTATTTIEGRGGLDTFDVSTDAPTNAGDLSGIVGNLILDGGSGNDVANVSDDGDSTGDTGTLTSSTLTGFSPGVLTYLDLATFNLDLGTGDDRLTVVSVHGGTTTIDLGGGNDDLALQSTPSGSTLTIHGEGGDDDFELGSTAVANDAGAIATGGTLTGIDGAVTIDGDDPQASDTLHLDDTGNAAGGSGTLTRDTITGFGMAAGITYLDVEHLTMALGDGIDDVDVTSTNGPGDADAVSETDTTLLLGGGDDRVDVSSTGAPTSGDVNAILGHLTIDGQAGTDTVNVSDTADTAGNTGELTATDLTGLGMGTPGVVGHGITYAGLEYLNIDLGTGNDVFTVHSTHAGETTLDTRGGDDTVDVGGDDQTVDDVAGFLDIDTGTGDDAVTVNDQATSSEQIGRVTDTEISGLGATIDPLNDPADAVWAVTIDGAASGTVTLSIGTTTTDAFAFNADADLVRDRIVAALDADLAATITTADVLVSRTPLLRLDGIVFRITFVGALAGQAGRDLGAVVVNDVDLSNLPSQTVALGQVGMSDGRIEYSSVETLEINLGTDVDHVALDSTGATTLTTINGGDGPDVLDVETIAHEVVVNGQGGDDTLQVNVFPQDPDINDIDALLTLNGAADSDTFFIQLSSVDESFINVTDTGASGIDDLYVQGSAIADQFLLRAELVALLNSFGPLDYDRDENGFLDDLGYINAEYVSYGSGIENLVVNTLGGNDNVALDDTTVATTINLGDGKDQVQVGQLFGEECIDDAGEGIDPGLTANVADGYWDDFNCFDERFIPPKLIDTTQGMLSNGISQSTTVNGGAGNDLMIVFHNLAVLALNGQDGDDTFVIRTFLEEDSETQLDAGEGTDVISYVMNAPVNVNGGAGYDRLYVVGTEADDIFVITVAGIYGGGRLITYVNIELLGLDTVEGNDRIYVQSTDPDVAVEVYGGLGSDTIEIGSNLVPTGADGEYAPIYASADDLVGHSGLIVHEVESTLGTWDALTIDGIAVEVVDDDEAALLIIPTDGTTLVAEGGLVDSYDIVLTRAPDSDVRVDVLAAILTPEEQAALAYNVQLSLDGVTWSERGVSLYFTSADWFIGQTVHVRGYDDAAAEGRTVSAVRHVVNGVLRGTVTGRTTNTMTDAGVAFGSDLVGKQLIFTSGAAADQAYTIDAVTGDTLTIVGVFEDLPGVGSSYEIRGVGEYDEVVLNDLAITIIDNDVSEVVVIESGVDTIVREDGATDTFDVLLSAPDTVDRVVTIAAIDGLCFSTSTDANPDCGDLTITFTLGQVGPVTVTVSAEDDGIVEGFQYLTILVVEGSAVVGRVLTGTVDDDTPGVLVTETDGSTVVAEREQVLAAGGAVILDTYTLELTADPGTETVTLTIEAIPTKTQYDPDIYTGGDRITYEAVQVEVRYRRDGGSWSGWALYHSIDFTSAGWTDVIEVEVRAYADDVIDGRILQAFPEAPARVNRIQGALYVDGGVSAFGYPLANFQPVLLPGESSSENHITPNSAFDVIEDHAVDTLIVHNEGDVADSDLVMGVATATPTTLSDELLAYLGLPPNPPGPPADVSRFSLTGLGMGALGIQYDQLEVLDVWLGSGDDSVTIETTHTGTTTVRGHAGDDTFDVIEIVGHTRILGGADDDAVTVTDAGTLESIDAQLLISGGGDTYDPVTGVDDDDGSGDTVVVDDTADTTDDRGTLTQTSLIGLDMDSETPDDLFSLELSDDVTSFTIHVTANRPAVPAEDIPGIDLLDFAIVIDQEAIDELTAITALPYTGYAGTTVADIDAFLLAGLIQQALFPYVENADTDAYSEDPVTEAKTYTFPDGSTDDDRFATTGCGKTGTTGERDSRCAMSVYVWDSGTRVTDGGIRVFLIGFQGELAGLDIGFSVTPLTGTYATDLQRTDGITYDGLETLDLRLGEGHDLFNVRGTLPHTLLDTGPGDDVVFVSDAAGLYEHTRPNISGPEGLAAAILDADDLEELHERTLHGTVVYDDRTYDGSLDEIDGDLDIDTGTGLNTLAVSDHEDPDADTDFTISDSTIVGLATGAMTYTSTGGDLAGQGIWTRGGDAGMFGRGITVHLGTGSDIGTIESVRGGADPASPLQMTITTVYGNGGDDEITVDAPDVAKARLVINGDDGDDTVDGTDATLPLIVFGEDGNDDIQGGTNADILLGDDGRVILYRDDDPAMPTDEDARGKFYDVILGGAPVVLPQIVETGGSGLVDADTYVHDGVFETVDIIYTVFVDETVRDDIVRGGDGDDVVIGGVGDDGLDGEADRDVVIGDRTILTRNWDTGFTSPIVRALVGTTLLSGVTDAHQLDPDGTWPWTITLLDHSDTTTADRWGHDVAAGGPGEDVVFGQLGNDTLHGDGVLNADGDGFEDVGAVDTTNDRDDYVEGNGGNDTILGGLGQDDLIGGSSDLFGLVTSAMRQDGVDTVFGGNGDMATRNHEGLVGDDNHSRDADVILGDNGRSLRIVGTSGTSTGSFLSFVYDSYGPAGTERVIPRVVVLLDYSPIGEDHLLAVVDPASPVLVLFDPATSSVPANIGAGDFLHGESSDDVIHGMTGDDAIFGDAGDDDLYGDAGSDWISGGTGGDGIVSDHGRIITSRHGLTEPLHGVDAATTPETLATPGNLQVADVNQADTLHKAVELDLVIPTEEYTTFYIGDHDVVYGGWGDDFIHGGEGDDLLSGAEAIELYYTEDPWQTLRDTYGLIVDDELHGVLQHGVDRPGEFRCYDEFLPLAYVYVCDEEAQPVDDGSGPVPFLSNWALVDDTEPVDDGDDVIFGDGGDDWVVGGVGHDRAFGGWGDDLLDMDDDKSTNGGANDAPDAQTGPPSYADIAYGGAGRDVLIANTGADRLIDWVGEYNSYVVPFSPYGAFTISRQVSPHIKQYLYDLSAAEGADITRGGVLARNGEPFGELGLVEQQDDAWGDQTGAPDDPQAGNTQGRRDVLRYESFDSAVTASQAFAVDSGSWDVRNGRYESVAVIGQDAVSLFYLDAAIPTTFEVVATVNSDKDRAGYRSNAYLVFDYMSGTDFKFAGLEMGTDKVEIGWRTAAGWQVLASVNLKLDPNTNYDLRLWVEGQVVSLYVDGVLRLTYDFGSPLLVPGDPSTALDPLTDGMIGFGSNGAVSRVDDIAVQVLAPDITFTITDEFVGVPPHTVSGGAGAVAAGTWTLTPDSGATALSRTTLTIAPSALLTLDTVLATDAIAGFAFDLGTVDRFKFAVLDVVTGLLLFGHVAAGAWVVEASYAVSIAAGTAHAFALSLDGATAQALVDGELVAGHSWFNLLNDGDLALLARGGAATFEHLTLATDDPALEPVLPFVSVSDASVVEGDGTTQLVVTVTLSRTHDEDVTVSWTTADGTAIAGQDYAAASGTVTILAGQTTATFTVDVLGDGVIEPDETFWVGLTDPAGAIIGDGSAQLTILNDDVDTIVDVATTDATASEADADPAVFTITRTGSTSGELLVDLAWGGTAGFGVDYTVDVTGGTLSADGAVLTIADGVDTVTLTVVPLTDSLAEATETITLTVLPDQDYGVGADSASVDLLDDAALPVVSIGDATVVEGDRGAAWATLTLTLSEASAQTITVTARTYEGTATAGTDFRTEVFTVSFAPGATTATVRVRIYSDRTRELDETLTVELSAPTGAVIGDGVGVITILDDDGGRLTASTLGTGRDVTPVTMDAVSDALAAAEAWWASRGYDIAALDVRVLVVDLQGRTLAVTSGTRILLDVDAAGHGWAAAGRPAGLDLVTVLVHELGHVLGLEHGDAPTAEIGDVMRGTLDTALPGPRPASPEDIVTTTAAATPATPSSAGVGSGDGPTSVDVAPGRLADQPAVALATTAATRSLGDAEPGSVAGLLLPLLLLGFLPRRHLVGHAERRD